MARGERIFDTTIQSPPDPTRLNVSQRQRINQPKQVKHWQPLGKLLVPEFASQTKPKTRMELVQFKFEIVVVPIAILKLKKIMANEQKSDLW